MGKRILVLLLAALMLTAILGGCKSEKKNDVIVVGMETEHLYQTLEELICAGAAG